MPFFNEQVDITRTTYRIVRIVLLPLIFLFVFISNGILSHADTTAEFTHYHSAKCYEGDKITCKKKEGSIQVSLNTLFKDWTNEPVLISVGVMGVGDITLSSKPTEWNGGERGTELNYLAKKNGKYTCKVYSNSGQSRDLDITISNIDLVKPTMNVDYSPKDFTTESVTLTIDAYDNESGLPSKAYSIDGGNKFYASPSFDIKKNGTYEVAVKDKAGNISSKKIVIDNIDTEGPQITFFGADKEGWVNGDITLTVQAADKGSGLAKYPYSFNNGENFTSNPNLKVTTNGEYKVLLKDKIGNTSSKSFTVSTIDRDNPTIKTLSTDCSDWTCEGVIITVTASDLTSGIAKEGYSFDGGKTYQESNCYLVNKNSTVYVYVKDKAGNTATQSIKISNIDNKLPEITNISKSVSKWTNSEYEITVEASDKESGLAALAYSFNGGESFTSNPSFTVKNNGLINICVKDKAGNIANREYKIENIDKDSPKISGISLDNDKWTNGKVTLYVNASDDISGLATSPYSFNGGSFTSSNRFTVSENGKVTISVVDKAGNESKESFNITNIDNKAPSILDISKDISAWTRTGVTVKVTAKDDQSGIMADGYSFDGGNTFGKSDTCTVSDNKCLNVAVKDKAGNIAHGKIEVTNIDKTAPYISVKKSKESGWTNGDITINITASDNMSGLASSPYSMDGKSFGDNPSFAISENGNYCFYVKDQAGNISKASCKINNIDKDCPEITGIRKSTEDWTEDGLTISIEANDALSGLCGAAYSFDGGNRYVSTSSALIKNNGDYEVCVRDQAGNVTHRKITIANIGKNPSETEKERYEAQKEAEERERQRQEAEEERKRIEEDLVKKRKELENSQDESEKTKLQSELSDIEKEYEKKKKTIITLEEKKAAAEKNVVLLSEKVESEKKSSIIGNVIEAFHDESKDIAPVEVDEKGEIKKVSVKDFVDASEMDQASTEDRTDKEEGSQETKKVSNGRILLAGIILLLTGIGLAMSFNYVYMIDGKKIKRLAFVKVKNDTSRLLVSIPESKLKEEGKYRIYYSFISRLVRKNKPVYVSVEGIENVFTTNEGKYFDYCTQ